MAESLNGWNLGHESLEFTAYIQRMMECLSIVTEQGRRPTQYNKGQYQDLKTC